MTDQQQATNGGELTPQARHEIAQYRMQHLDSALEGAPMAVRMYLDPILFDRVNKIAEMISSSNSMPEHLRGDLGACMNVIDRAWNWGLSPWSVAQGQFTVRKGATPGYYGRLIIAAINNSGRIEGGLRFEHFADDGASWDRVLGKFENRNSTKRQDADGNPIKYQVATYNDKDEQGLGVLVIGKLKGEDKPREMRVYLRQCQPRNSVIWATDPMTQIIYTAARRFGNAYCPDILLGVRTEDDFGPEDRAGGGMRDITPRAPEPVDLKAEGIRGGGQMGTNPRAAEPDTKASRAPEQPGGSMASTDTKAATTESPRAAEPTETVDPETGEVTERQPKKQRRSYRQITDEVKAMLADAETEDEVDAIVADEVTSGVRANTELMREVEEAETAARQRIAEAGADRAARPAQQDAQAAQQSGAAAQQAAAGQPANLFPQG